MSITYFPCQYADPETNIPCGRFFPETSELSGFCPEHRGALIPADAGVAGENYIDARNTEIKFCHEMTLDELEIHIASIEVEMSVLKTKYYSARGVRGDKLEKLSDAEREVRRKWRSSAPQVNKAEPKPKKDAITKVTDKLNQDQRSFMDKAGIRKTDLLNMDVDALLAKFAKGKGNQTDAQN